MKRIISLLLCTVLVFSLFTIGIVDAFADAVPVRYHYMFPLDDETENHVQTGYTDADGYVQLPNGMPDRDDEGYTFIDWYADETFSTRFDFSEPVTDETDLYARWVPDEDCCDLFVYLDATATEPTYGVDVPRGDVYGEPAAPGRDGAVFCGWYTDRALTQEYDPYEPITEDTNLFPRWVKEEDMCTVYIYLNATDAGYTAGVEIPRGDTYEPADPGRDGEVFFGWYTDRELTKKYDPAKPIMEDTSLFPRWEKEEDVCAVYIYLDTMYLSPVAGVDVLRGDIFGAPAAPGRENATFGGWYTDRELTKPYDATKPITEDTHLFPRWITQEAETYTPGDADCDGDVAVLDATTIQRKLAGITVDKYNEKAADADGDNEVTIFDATAIQRYLVGLPTQLYALINDDLYARSVSDAMTIDKDEILPLVYISKDDDRVIWNDAGDKVLMLFMNKYPDSYPAGKDVNLKWGNVWGVSAGEVYQWLKNNSSGVKNWNERLHQVLGMPTSKGYTTITAMWVDASLLYRPAYVTDPAAPMSTTYTSSGDDAFDNMYKEWFDSNVTWSYYDSAYPWTRLGYTYDWADNGTAYGLSEFLVFSGADVTIEYTYSVDEFIAYASAL